MGRRLRLRRAGDGKTVSESKKALLVAFTNNELLLRLPETPTRDAPSYGDRQCTSGCPRQPHRECNVPRDWRIRKWVKM